MTDVLRSPSVPMQGIETMPNPDLSDGALIPPPRFTAEQAVAAPVAMLPYDIPLAKWPEEMNLHELCSAIFDLGNEIAKDPSRAAQGQAALKALIDLRNKKALNHTVIHEIDRTGEFQLPAQIVEEPPRQRSRFVSQPVHSTKSQQSVEKAKAAPAEEKSAPQPTKAEQMARVTAELEAAKAEEARVTEQVPALQSAARNTAEQIRLEAKTKYDQNKKAVQTRFIEAAQPELGPATERQHRAQERVDAETQIVETRYANTVAEAERLAESKKKYLAVVVDELLRLKEPGAKEYYVNDHLKEFLPELYAANEEVGGLLKEVANAIEKELAPSKAALIDRLAEAAQLEKAAKAKSETMLVEVRTKITKLEKELKALEALPDDAPTQKKAKSQAVTGPTTSEQQDTSEDQRRVKSPQAIQGIGVRLSNGRVRPDRDGNTARRARSEADTKKSKLAMKLAGVIAVVGTITGVIVGVSQQNSLELTPQQQLALIDVTTPHWDNFPISVTAWKDEWAKVITDPRIAVNGKNYLLGGKDHPGYAYLPMLLMMATSGGNYHDPTGLIPMATPVAQQNGADVKVAYKLEHTDNPDKTKNYIATPTDGYNNLLTAAHYADVVLTKIMPDPQTEAAMAQNPAELADKFVTAWQVNGDKKDDQGNLPSVSIADEFPQFKDMYENLAVDWSLHAPQSEQFQQLLKNDGWRQLFAHAATAVQKGKVLTKDEEVS